MPTCWCLCVGAPQHPVHCSHSTELVIRAERGSSHWQATRQTGAWHDATHRTSSSRGHLRSAPLNANGGLISFCKSVHHYNVKSLHPGWEPASHVNVHINPPPSPFLTGPSPLPLRRFLKRLLLVGEAVYLMGQMVTL